MIFKVNIDKLFGELEEKVIEEQEVNEKKVLKKRKN